MQPYCRRLFVDEVNTWEVWRTSWIAEARTASLKSSSIQEMTMTAAKEGNLDLFCQMSFNWGYTWPRLAHRNRGFGRCFSGGQGIASWVWTPKWSYRCQCLDGLTRGGQANWWRKFWRAFTFGQLKVPIIRGGFCWCQHCVQADHCKQRCRQN